MKENSPSKKIKILPRLPRGNPPGQEMPSDSKLWVPPSFEETQPEKQRPKRRGIQRLEGHMPSGRDNPGISGHANETPAAEGRRDSSSARRGKPDFTRRALIPLCLASLILILFVGWQLDRAGILGGSTQTHALPEGDFTEMPSEIQASLDTAMVELRTGFAANALKRLDLIEKRNPQPPSITYLSALAALQAGDPDQASQKADASIAKGERVSDCLALKAVLETQKHR
ncbi:MAG: hypothetical protein ACOVLK_00255, partial [Terrimicrobiaceae bacterium]